MQLSWTRHFWRGLEQGAGVSPVATFAYNDRSEVVSTAAGETAYTNVSAQGATHVKAFCDLNGNGEHDADDDILLVSEIPIGAMAQVNFAFGDMDGDGMTDAQERADGTDPYDKRNYGFDMSVSVTGIFRTTNSLTLAATFGDATLCGPLAMTANSWSGDFGFLTATNNEQVALTFWDDANSNGVHDAGETFIRQPLPVTNRTNAISLKLPYGNFDANGNELPDWWEVQTGLDAAGAANRAYDDPDGDGLINLHEFWSGTNPLVPDGSNTLLSVASRSIDDRIRGVDPATAIPRFVDYFINGSNGVFVANTNFWARDLDLSCVNVWHNGEHPGTKAATLITRKHVVLAHHWVNDNNGYTFCGTNGQICIRTLVQSEQISDDLRLGKLDAPLPDSFKPASVLSTNFVRYLSAGKYLPTLCLNQEKGASIAELMAVDAEITASGGRHYTHYGNTCYTNLVSSQRNAVRGATVDGNSGCPVFLVVDNELVLLFSKHLGYRNIETWSPFWGPMVPFRLEAIQSKIDEWEGDDADQYQIVPFDLSAFGEIVNQ